MSRPDAADRARQVAVVAGRRRCVLGLPARGRRHHRAASTAATACSPSCASTSTTWTSTRWCISHLHADHFLDLVPYSYALTYAPRQQPVPVPPWPGTDNPARPRLIAPPGARGDLPQGHRHLGQRRPDRERVRAGGVRAGRPLPRSARSRFSFREVPHFSQTFAIRAIVAQRRRRPGLRRRLQPDRGADRVRRRRRPAADRGHAARGPSAPASAATSRPRRPASTRKAAGRRAAWCSPTSPTSSTGPGRARQAERGVRRPGRAGARGHGLRDLSAAAAPG